MRSEKRWGGVKHLAERDGIKAKVVSLKKKGCRVKDEGGDLEIVYGTKDKYDSLFRG